MHKQGQQDQLGLECIQDRCAYVLSSWAPLPALHCHLTAVHALVVVGQAHGGQRAIGAVRAAGLDRWHNELVEVCASRSKLLIGLCNPFSNNPGLALFALRHGGHVLEVHAVLRVTLFCNGVESMTRRGQHQHINVLAS
eukprot:scaffold4868_cov416-Prasinococcus_capsulatus_cf.AAC.4